MINNIFSIFDPSSFGFNSAWSVLFIPLILSAVNKNNTSAISNIFVLVNESIVIEFKHILNPNEENEASLFAIIFSLILILNVASLYPPIPAITAQIVVVAPIALTTWGGAILIGWWNNTNQSLLHLVPQATPTALINFMVVIELTSNLIRPLTLSVRLVANIVAGHLLISLLIGALLQTSITSTLFLMPLCLALSSLEVGVALVQSYVLSTLLTLYISEI